MAKPMNAEDILPLVAELTPSERARLLRLIAASSTANAAKVYSAVPPGHDEFSSDEEPLEWEANDWEDVD